MIEVARTAWPDRWTELTPSPIILSTWGGYDTDGRTDIGWWDTLRLRLEMKRLQLARLLSQVVAAPELAARIDQALDADGAAGGGLSEYGQIHRKWLFSHKR